MNQDQNRLSGGRVFELPEHEEFDVALHRPMFLCRDVQHHCYLLVDLLFAAGGRTMFSTACDIASSRLSAPGAHMICNPAGNSPGACTGSDAPHWPKKFAGRVSRPDRRFQARALSRVRTSETGQGTNGTVG